MNDLSIEELTERVEGVKNVWDSIVRTGGKNLTPFDIVIQAEAVIQGQEDLIKILSDKADNSIKLQNLDLRKYTAKQQATKVQEELNELIEAVKKGYPDDLVIDELLDAFEALIGWVERTRDIKVDKITKHYNSSFIEKLKNRPRKKK